MPSADLWVAQPDILKGPIHVPLIPVAIEIIKVPDYFQNFGFLFIYNISNLLINGLYTCLGINSSSESRGASVAGPLTPVKKKMATMPCGKFRESLGPSWNKFLDLLLYNLHNLARNVLYKLSLFQ